MKSLAGWGFLLTSPHLQREGTNFWWAGSHAAMPGSLGASALGAVPLLYLVSLHPAFVCASGCHTGHSGRRPPTGVPRWVQVPEGVIYATITLGTACPAHSWAAIDPVPAAWLSEAGRMPERGHCPLPVPVPGSCMPCCVSSS